MSYQTWMADNTTLHSKKLRYICLPVTHDSGTCDLQEQMTPDQAAWERWIYDGLEDVAKAIEDIPGIGKYIPNVGRFLQQSIYESAKALATATRRTIAQQLNDGIRGFDLRIYYDDATAQFYTYHGFVGTPMIDVLTQIRAFMEATTGEIVYVTCGHYQPPDSFPQTTFESLLSQYLKSYLYTPVYENGAITNDPFDTVYTDIIGQGGTSSSRVILVNVASENSPLFWPRSYSPPDGGENNTVLYGFYTDTTSANRAISTQQSQLTTALSKDLPFALYMTLTPSPIDYGRIIFSNLGYELMALGAKISKVAPPVGGALISIGTPLTLAWTSKWRTLMQLSQLLDADLNYVVGNDFLLTAKNEGATENPISLLYLDWYETTHVVNLAINLSAGKGFTWQGNKPIVFTGSPSNTQANYQPQIGVLDATMYMIYPYNNNLYLASSTDPLAQTWNGGGAISCNGSTPQTNFSTAVITWRDELLVAYTGTGNQSTTVLAMTFDGKTWSGNKPMVAGKNVPINSQNTPSFAIYDDTLYMAFRGVGKDYNIYITSMGPEEKEWSTPTAIPTISGQSQQPLTQATPTLAVYDGLLWVLFVGWNNEEIYYATYDGKSWSGNEAIAVTNNSKHPNPETNYGPSAIAFDGILRLIYKGQGSDDLYESTYVEEWRGNQQFSSFAHVSVQTNYNPGLVNYQDTLVMIYKGEGSNTIYSMVYGA